jgi:hypothetical protein
MLATSPEAKSSFLYHWEIPSSNSREQLLPLQEKKKKKKA